MGSPESIRCSSPWSPLARNCFCGNKFVSSWVVLEFDLGLVGLRSVTVPEANRKAKLIWSTGNGEGDLLLLLLLHERCSPDILRSEIATDGYCC